MQQYNKTRGIRGIVSLYNDALRYRDMITNSSQERLRILIFWKKYGDKAAIEAFGASRATLFRWQKDLHKGKGKLEALNPQSTAPKNKRKRIIPKLVEDFIRKEREWERIGKEKLAKLLRDDGIANLSDSTVGRIISDLKKQGKLPDPIKYSLSGKTGKLIEKKTRKSREKLRSKGHSGQLAKADTIVRFTNGIKRYILTAIDLESEFAFAYAYTSHSSKAAADFMRIFKQAAPLSLTHIQTDNGSEFAKYFEKAAEQLKLIHYHSRVRTPKDNPFDERFNRTLEDEFIDLGYLTSDCGIFNKELTEWLVEYNFNRPHQSLNYLTPIQFETNYSKVLPMYPSSTTSFRLSGFVL